MKILNKLTYRYLNLNKRKCITTLVSIILITVLLFSVGIFVSTIRKTLYDSIVNENGTKHVLFRDISYDNYGGLRAYPKVDENNEPVLDANGNPVIERFWAGNPDGNFASYFSLLLKTAQDYDSTIRTYQDFFKFLGEERQCLIKSEKTSFGGRGETIKQVIKEFI